MRNVGPQRTKFKRIGRSYCPLVYSVAANQWETISMRDSAAGGSCSFRWLFLFDGRSIVLTDGSLFNTGRQEKTSP